MNRALDLQRKNLFTEVQRTKAELTQICINLNISQPTLFAKQKKSSFSIQGCTTALMNEKSQQNLENAGKSDLNSEDQGWLDCKFHRIKGCCSHSAAMLAPHPIRACFSSAVVVLATVRWLHLLLAWVERSPAREPVRWPCQALLALPPPAALRKVRLRIPPRHRPFS